MEIITIQNLVKLAKNGYFPLFNSKEIRESLKDLAPFTSDNEKKLKRIIKEMKILKSYERKKLFIQGLNQKDKNIFIQHLFEKAHRLDEIKRIKYN